MKKIISVSTLALFLGALMFVSSCSKQDDGHYGPSSESQQQKTRKKIQDLIKKLPLTKVSNDAKRNGATGKNNTLGGGWDFSNPGSGNTWTSPSGVTYSTSSNTIYVSGTSSGSSGGSFGTVVAGPTSLDINGTFCFSADFTGNMDFFGMGFSGVSGVIGVSGDLKALSNASSESNFFDLFNGLAYYIVYDGQASGSYDVVDWFSEAGNLGNNNALENKCFAFIWDFQNGRLYMSSSGTINVNGGSMEFNGEYFEISGFVLSGNDINTENITFSTVSGFGTMGCQ